MTELPVPGGAQDRHRLRVRVHGTVQGIGFRPFVYRLATALSLNGAVWNAGDGLWIDAEGPRDALDALLRRIPLEAPPGAQITRIDAESLPPLGRSGFAVIDSDPLGTRRTRLPPDIAMCDDCSLELADPEDRRYRHPFISCTRCGPRFSITLALPYDRANTTMRDFPLCERCRKEYSAPADRRFHAQPIACPDCGPQLALWDPRGRILAVRDTALAGAADVLRRGGILALKGLGGFQLLVDARNADAVARLRRRKARPEKPLAVMLRDLREIEAACEVSPLEAALLSSREAPIVLLKRLPTGEIAVGVAPDSPWLGAMLPYTPLHRLLLEDLGFPVVATSGNRSGEPLCIDELEALDRLEGIADLFLVHDRPIARQVDDSVARVIADGPVVLRHARGYAPTYLSLGSTGSAVLAVGGHQKSAVALAVEDELVLGQHIGDLGSLEADNAFIRTIDQLIDLYDARAPMETHRDRNREARWQRMARVACDLHPDYRSTRLAEQSGAQLERVQHHHAHLLACLADNGLAGMTGMGRTGNAWEHPVGFAGEDRVGSACAGPENLAPPRPAGSDDPEAAVETAPPVLGVIWDGSGYGGDDSIWGGEWLLLTDGSLMRVARMRHFRLPGGERAVREPRRTALGLLFALMGDRLFELDTLAPLRALPPRDRELLHRMLNRGINAPHTSSVGRLFDAVASLLGLRQVTSYEGQAALELEAAVDPAEPGSYPFAVHPSRDALSWEALSREALSREALSREALSREALSREALSREALSREALYAPRSAMAEAPLIVDWGPLFTAMLSDLEHGVRAGRIAARFHATLARMIGVVARQVFDRLPGLEGPPRVALSGGCFQNRELTERAIRELASHGLHPLTHHRVPSNDGGLAAGQALAALRNARGTR